MFGALRGRAIAGGADADPLPTICRVNLLQEGRWLPPGCCQQRVPQPGFKVINQRYSGLFHLTVIYLFYDFTVTPVPSVSRGVVFMDFMKQLEIFRGKTCSSFQRENCLFDYFILSF